MITYLNDPDWMLRADFLKSIVKLGPFLGSHILEMFILPIIKQALADSEEMVVIQVLTCLKDLTILELFHKSVLKDLIAISIPLVCHPNNDIRAGFLYLIQVLSNFLHVLQSYSHLKCTTYITQ